MARDDVIFADFANERDSLFPVYGDVANKLKGRGVDFFVAEGAVGDHLHTRGDDNIEGKLARERGVDAFDAVGEVEDARSVVHTAGEQTREGEDTDVRRRERTTFVFLTTCTLAGEEVWKGAFDAGAFDGFVDVEADMILGGELEGFLVVANASLGVVIFAFATDGHHRASIARFYIMHAEGIVSLVGGFELRLVIIDKTDGFVMSDEFDVVGVGIAGDGGHIAIWGGEEEVSRGAVFEPIAIPATVPALEEKAVDAETSARVDIFKGVLGGSAVAVARTPSPLANIHCPPYPEELEGLYPRKVGARRVVEV